jgi:hypothetical protein
LILAKTRGFNGNAQVEIFGAAIYPAFPGFIPARKNVFMAHGSVRDF